MSGVPGTTATCTLPVGFITFTSAQTVTLAVASSAPTGVQSGTIIVRDGPGAVQQTDTYAIEVTAPVGIALANPYVGAAAGLLLLVGLLVYRVRRRAAAVPAA